MYCSVVLASSLVIRRPPAPALQLAPPPAAPSVHVDRVASTPQFWLLFSTTALLCTGGNTSTCYHQPSELCPGMGILSVAAPMVQSVFSPALPALVTTSFASLYLMSLATGNLAGRLGWAALSDKIGHL